jgi:hypothetical protein
MQMMFQRDVMVLILSSAGMCFTSFFGLGLQKAIKKGNLSWNGAGWVIQSVSLPTSYYFWINRFANIGVTTPDMGVSFSCGNNRVDNNPKVAMGMNEPLPYQNLPICTIKFPELASNLEQDITY